MANLRLLTTKDIAKTLEVHRATVERWVALGWLKVDRIGTTFVATPDAVYALQQRLLRQKRRECAENERILSKPIEGVSTKRLPPLKGIQAT